MTLSGILSSPSQRRSFLLASGAVLGISILITLGIAYLAPNTPVWNALNSLFISIVASGVFAIVAGLYISYFFVDPSEISAMSKVLPKDIDQTLQKIATQAMNYKIFVRTGRHFRAEVLPILISQARKTRHPIRIEIILLDWRDSGICERYSNYRKTSSFDRNLWDTNYVRTEILATIYKLIEASQENPGLLDIQLYLSKRLSTFRIEGSSEEILITREDPKDLAARYYRTHHEFSAFSTEFVWIRDEAYRVTRDETSVLPKSLQAMFGDSSEIDNLAGKAEMSAGSPSPYVR